MTVWISCCFIFDSWFICSWWKLF